jgi:hypothetical protein
MCPNYKKELVCPCKLCVKRREKGKFDLWIWLDDDETIKCPLCGFETHADYWQDYKINQDR